MNLSDEQITLLTKGIIKHSVIPQLSNLFDYPSFENFDKAVESIPNSDLILKTWLDQAETVIDVQINKIYKDIEESIVEHLKDCYGI